MLKAYVGVMSQQGLAVLQPERDETLSLVRRSVQDDLSRVGFWAVLDDTEARCVETLFVGGLRREAMMFLDRSAREMGRILPTDPQPSLHGTRATTLPRLPGSRSPQARREGR